MKKSIFKKINTIKKNGIKPVLKGIANKTIKQMDTEKKAIKRADICFRCDFMVDEVVSFLKVDDDDKRIAKKMCNECGCSISLKIRQNESICKRWNEKV